MLDSANPKPHQDVRSALVQRADCFASNYWSVHIDDQRHFALTMSARETADYRLLYDSWLWSRVLGGIIPIRQESHVLELLPGHSLTIPIALASARFCGTLHQLNDEPPAQSSELSKTLGATWIRSDLSSFVGEVWRYDAVLGNHILDDLVFSRSFPRLEERERVYREPLLCKEAWQAITDPHSFAVYKSALEDLFGQILLNMSPSAVLVLRQYASTFALQSNDLPRAHAEMTMHIDLAASLQRRKLCRAFMLDLSAISVPEGAKPPGSFLLLRKTSDEAFSFQLALPQGQLRPGYVMVL